MSGTTTSSTISAITTVSSGVTISGAIVMSGGGLEVEGGTISAITVASSGGIAVFSGSTADGITIQSGGVAAFASGATGSGLTVYGGGNLFDGVGPYAGATISSTVIDGGSLTVSSGGVADGNIALNSGSITVVSGGTASGSVIESGAHITADGGTILGVALGNSGIELVLSSGSASGTTVYSGGVQLVLTTGTVQNTTVDTGGIQYAGFTSGKTTSAGGTLISSVIDGGNQSVLSGGVAIGTTITANGQETVYSGGTISGSTLGVDGNLLLTAGAVVSGAIDFTGAGATLGLDGITNFTNVISGFDANGPSEGDSIFFVGASSAGVGTASLGADNVLTVTEGAATYTVHLDPSQNFAGDHFSVSGGVLSVCFCPGTRILTARGEIAVESLADGETVITHDGRLAPIVWIGHRRLDASRHPRPEQIRPIRIEAGAIADRIPARDLYVSPDHALYLDGMLVPAKALVNGRSIAQVERDAIEYYHIELPSHDILLAEALPVESFLDTGNRAFFAGQRDDAIILHPNMMQSEREARSCAPFTESGPAIVALRRRILARLPVGSHTSDPAIVLIAGDRRLEGVRTGERQWSINLSSMAGGARLSSRGFVPAHEDPASEDRRRLGLDIASVTLDGTRLDLADERLAKGWYAAEPAHRWTDGDAALPASLLAGAHRLTIELASEPTYPTTREAPIARRMLAGRAR
ncbi:Hint domain-containing protein [Acidiphilium acidophilum]|uniref:Hint domain-containing protein n=1 Tax=Acidiphilium acidophilum TaxID=76588 RepID=UPI002E8E69F2|nr:Hint domain-containing protein [Acidiphilium acidophilum]